MRERKKLSLPKASLPKFLLLTNICVTYTFNCNLTPTIFKLNFEFWCFFFLLFFVNRKWRNFYHIDIYHLTWFEYSELFTISEVLFSELFLCPFFQWVFKSDRDAWIGIGGIWTPVCPVRVQTANHYTKGDCCVKCIIFIKFILQ